MGHVNLNSMSEVTGASTSRLQDSVAEEEEEEWVLERRLLLELLEAASEIPTEHFNFESISLLKCRDSGGTVIIALVAFSRFGPEHHSESMP